MRWRKWASLALAVVLVLGAVPSYAADNGVNAAPTYGTETLIEFEDGWIRSGNVDIRPSRTSSGQKCVLVPSGGRLDNPAADYTPDISYQIEIPAAGTYTILIRYSAADTGKDSLYVRWDGGQYKQTGFALTENAWGWAELSSLRFTANEPGVYTLGFLHREPGLLMDAFFVTADAGRIDTEAVEKQIAENGKPTSPEFAEDSDAKTVDLENGFGLFEAEDMTINGAAYDTLENQADASGGHCITPKTAHQSGVPGQDMYGLEFNFNVDRDAAAYVVWVRASIPSDSNDSVWMSLDGEPYQMAEEFEYNGDDNGAFVWRRVAVYENLFNGTKHNFRLYPRERDNRIDKILITDQTSRVPTGMGELIPVTLPENQYPMPSILPPEGQHPRLYLTAADIPSIRGNMDKPENAQAKQAFEALLKKETNGRLSGSLMDDYTNYNASTMGIIEAYAFQYVLTGDTAYGDKAKEAVLNLLDTATLDPEQQDITRQMGHTIFLGAQVYDWCYDRFTPDERETLISRCEQIAMQMEVGYPPDGQGAVCGHGGEAQILRDLLGLAIATYDERPDIYNFVGGRFFSEFIEPRNYWYASATHHQGDSYGSYRYYWEVLAQTMIYRMSGGDTAGGVKVFDDTQADVPYFWIYTRRPDGQVLRTGDCTNESGARGVYWTPYVDTMFLAGNFYGDSLLKGEYTIENPSGGFSYGITTRSPVVFLLFNDPDLAAEQSKESLPLTRYFGSPNGMMVARTGWDVNASDPAQSGDVVAMMKIGERWGANHHHLDAGSFQLYYKGILASESGYYESYGSVHDQNYNKASIAHNVLTIYDPNEKFTRFTGTDRYGNTVSFPNGVNDGGQRRPGGEPATMEEWSAGAYDTGKVLDYAFESDAHEPAYSYIKGDITQAYGGSGQGKVSNVTRAMAFLPLDDADYPAMMVVFDKVASTNASFKKKWLLHTQQEPEISGNTAIVKRDTDGYNGKLTVQTLLPEKASVTKIGGAGKQFWVGDQTGDFENDGYNFDLMTDPSPDSAIEAGWGRIEVSPADENLSDTFLHVLAVSDADNAAQPLDSKLIRGEALTGVQTAGKALLFADTDTPSSAKNRVQDTASFTLTGGEMLDILIMGVKAGQWRVSANGESALYTATEDGGTLYFPGGAGDYTLTYIGDGYGAQIASAQAEQSGAGYTVNVTLSGSYEGGVLLAGAYGADGRLLSLRRQTCTQNASYALAFAADETVDAAEFKVFLWEGGGAEPLAAGVTFDVLSY